MVTSGRARSVPEPSEVAAKDLVLAMCGPHVASAMARARCSSGRASSCCPRSHNIKAKLLSSFAASGWLGSVHPLVDGQGAFGQWPGCVGPSEVSQHRGQVAQQGRDSRMVGSVHHLVDGERPLHQRASLPGSPLDLQVDAGQVEQPGTVQRRVLAQSDGVVAPVPGRCEDVRKQHCPPRPVFRHPAHLAGASALSRPSATASGDGSAELPGTGALTVRPVSAHVLAAHRRRRRG